VTNLFLAAIIFLLANLQKNPLARIAGKFLAAFALYWALSSSLSTTVFRRIWGDLKSGRPSAGKISSKIMPKEVVSGKTSIEKTLKEVGDSIK
jgi:uncharacterized membrane protein